MAEARKKPIQLEWQGGISEVPATTNAKKISVKGRAESTAHSAGARKAELSTQGTHSLRTLKIRRETKGRGGHPVIILFQFEPAQSEASLGNLAQSLKSKLGAGGTVEENSVVLQTQQIEKVEKILAAQGIVSKRAGGF
jgi:translation initiation factor 1 (eIF-1/SUI1)